MVGFIMGNVGGEGLTPPKLDTPAKSGEILLGKEAINEKNEKIIGTIKSKAAAAYTPGIAKQTIAAGQYLSGVQTISAVPDETLTVAPTQSKQALFPSSGKWFERVIVEPAPYRDTFTEVYPAKRSLTVDWLEFRPRAIAIVSSDDVSFMSEENGSIRCVISCFYHEHYQVNIAHLLRVSASGSITYYDNIDFVWNITDNGFTVTTALTSQYFLSETGYEILVTG